MVQCVNLPPGSWPIALGTGAMRVLGVGACCWQSGRSARKGGGHTHVAETISLKLGPRAAQGHQFSREGTPCQFLRFSWE